MMELPVVMYIIAYNIIRHCYRNKGLSLAVIKNYLKIRTFLFRHFLLEKYEQEQGLAVLLVVV